MSLPLTPDELIARLDDGCLAKLYNAKFLHIYDYGIENGYWRVTGNIKALWVTFILASFLTIQNMLSYCNSAGVWSYTPWKVSVLHMIFKSSYAFFNAYLYLNVIKLEVMLTENSIW